MSPRDEAALDALLAEYDALSSRRDELHELYQECEANPILYWDADPDSHDLDSELAGIADGLVKALRGECYQLPD